MGPIFQTACFLLEHGLDVRIDLGSRVVHVIHGNLTAVLSWFSLGGETMIGERRVTIDRYPIGQSATTRQILRSLHASPTRTHCSAIDGAVSMGSELLAAGDAREVKFWAPRPQDRPLWVDMLFIQPGAIVDARVAITPAALRTAPIVCYYPPAPADAPACVTRLLEVPRRVALDCAKGEIIASLERQKMLARGRS